MVTVTCQIQTSAMSQLPRLSWEFWQVHHGHAPILCSQCHGEVDRPQRPHLPKIIIDVSTPTTLTTLEYILDSPSPDEGDEAEDPGLPAAHPGGGRGDGDGHPWTSSASCRCHGEEKEQGWLGFHCSSLFSHTRTSLLSPFGICQLSTCWKGLEITTAAVMQTIIIIIPCQ